MSVFLDVPPSVALRTLVAALAAEGREAPRALAGYRARVESELTLVLRTAAAREGVGAAPAAADDEHADAGAEAGRERVVQVEQVESTVDWSDAGAAPGPVKQHVIGYRTPCLAAGLPRRDARPCSSPCTRSPTTASACIGSLAATRLRRCGRWGGRLRSSASWSSRVAARRHARSSSAGSSTSMRRGTSSSACAGSSSSPAATARCSAVCSGRRGRPWRSPNWRTPSLTAGSGSPPGSASSGRAARHSRASSARRSASCATSATKRCDSSRPTRRPSRVRRAAQRR